MLVLHRRHITDCRYKDRGRNYQRCACPIWFDWRIGRKRVQKPIGTRDWQIAQIRARELEADGIGGEIVPLTIEQATEKFMADAKARGLREASLYKYRLLFKQMQAFAVQHGFTFLSQLDTGAVRAFRESWTNKNLSARKKLEHLKAFFRFCHDSGWIKENPAKIIKPPTVNDAPVLPFSDVEMKKILAACDTHRDPERAVQLRAIVQLMRHSGLRIGDACTLSRSKIDKNGLLELYTEKTGVKVRLPLKPEVIEALTKIPKNGDYYFWSGTSNRRTAINIWAETFQRLFERAGIADGHSHRFRHTFAARLLEKGVSMEILSKLLGHRSLKVTELHYASFGEGRQKQLEDAVRKAW